MQKEIKVFFKSLPELERNIFTLAFYEMLTDKEIIDVLKIPNKKFSKIYDNIKTKLVKFIKHEHASR